MKKVHFVFANIWLLVALVLYFGKTGYYQLFGAGRHCSPLGYGFITFCCVAFGVALLIAAWSSKD